MYKYMQLYLFNYIVGTMLLHGSLNIMKYFIWVYNSNIRNTFIEIFFMWGGDSWL